MQRFLKYFKGYIQRGFRECNDNEPQAQTLNVTILVIGFCAMFAALMNLIFSPENFAFIAPSLIFLSLILEQFRYRLTIKMVGGFYIIDDMTIQPNWPEGHDEKVKGLVAYLENRNDFNLTKMNWSTGVIIVVKK